MINRNVKDPPCRPEHARIAEVYKNFSEKKESQLENRWDQVYLALASAQTTTGICATTSTASTRR